MASISPTIFRAYDVRGVADRDLTEDAAHRIARGLGTLVRRAGGRRVVLGRDCRLSGERLARAAAAGLMAAGVDVVNVGVVPTPLVYFAAHTLPVDGLCVVTASHNPAEYNGLKMGVGTAALQGEEIQALRALVERGDFEAGQGESSTHDVRPAYHAYVRQNLRLGQRRLRVVVDAGNGTGGLVAVPLLEALGAEVVPLFMEMDGRFPHHHPDPSAAGNLVDLQARVREVKADLGLAYDGDADRLAAVDERGGVLWGDRLTLLFARALLAEHPGATVVGEPKCSAALFEDVARRGGRPILWRAGHSLIKKKMREEGALLGGEMSGHLFFADRWFGFDDAIYASGRLLELLSATAAPLSSLLSDLPPTWATPERHLPCPEERKFEIVRQAEALFARDHPVTTVDGVRVTFAGGWGLVKASNTQPLLVLRFEADSERRLQEIEDLVTGQVRALLRGGGQG